MVVRGEPGEQPVSGERKKDLDINLVSYYGLVGVVTTMGEQRCCAIGLQASSSMAMSKHNSQYNHLYAAVQR